MVYLNYALFFFYASNIEQMIWTQFVGNIANSESLLIIIGSNIGRMLFSSIKK